MKKINLKLIVFILVFLFGIGIGFYLGFKKEGDIEHSYDICTRFIDEFEYNYQNTELEEKEKQILELAKETIIKEYGNESYKDEWPIEAKKIEDTWYISGTPQCEDSRSLCIRGAVLVIISDESLEIISIGMDD